MDGRGRGRERQPTTKSDRQQEQNVRAHVRIISISDSRPEIILHYKHSCRSSVSTSLIVNSHLDAMVLNHTRDRTFSIQVLHLYEWEELRY